MLTQILFWGIFGLFFLPLLGLVIWQGVKESRVPPSAEWYRFYK